MGAKIIAIANKKGGVGKTSITINLAIEMAKSHRVLVVDLDSQANTTSCLVDNFRDLSFTTLTLFMDRRFLATKAVVQCNPNSRYIDNLYIIGAHLKLQDAYEHVNSRSGRDTILKRHLEHLRKDFDVILVDCPPDTGPATINALTACDLVLVPVDGSFSVDAIQDILETMSETDNDNLDYVIVINKHDKRSKKFNSDVDGLLVDHQVASTKIRVSKPINNSQMEYIPLTFYSGDKSAEEDYNSLAKEIWDYV